MAPSNIGRALGRSDSGRIGGSYLAGKFADAVAISPRLVGGSAIDWLVEQPSGRLLFSMISSREIDEIIEKRRRPEC